MRQNHGGCIMFERDLHDFSGPDARRIEGAVEKFNELNDSMLVVQQQQGEHLPRSIPQLGLQIIPGQLGRGERISPLQLLGQMALAHLQHRLQLGVLGRPQPVGAAEALLLGAEQRPQRAKLLQQLAGEVHRAQSVDPGTQEDRQQFGIGQHPGTPPQQLLSRAFLLRPLLDAHLSLPHPY